MCNELLEGLLPRYSWQLAVWRIELEHVEHGVEAAVLEFVASHVGPNPGLPPDPRARAL